jgi:hypothetical protein
MKKFDFRNPVRFLLLFGFLLVICLYYVIHKPFDGGFIARIGIQFYCLLIAFTFIASAGGLGKWILNYLNFESKFSSLLSLAVGTGCLSLTFLIISLVIGVHAWWGWIVFIFLVLLLSRHIIGWTNEIYRECVDIWQGSTLMGKIIGGLCFVIIISTLVIGLAPPVKFDALVYHLALPQEYIEQGSITHHPDNMFWGMPQVGEMLYTWLMLLAGEKAAVCFGWLIGVMSLAGFLQFVAQRYNATVGWVAIAALLCGYTMAASLSWGYIDWFAVLFGTCVIISLDSWVETEGRKALILTGVLAGFGLGCKYTAGVIILAALAVILWRVIIIIKNPSHLENQRGISYAIYSLCLFCLSILVITLPWWIKNILGTGNPFYPFFFPSGEMDSFRLDFYRLPASGSIWETIFLPFFATFFGLEGASRFSASIGPLLLGLGIFTWLPQPSQTEHQKRTSQMCFVIALSGVLIWMVGSRFSEFLIQTRVYFVLFPAFAILSALGFNGFSQLRPFGIRLQNVIGALVIMCLGFTSLEVSLSMVKMGSLKYLLNLETAEDYLGENLGWFFPAVHQISEDQSNPKVLMLFEPRGYFCIPYCDSDEVLDQWKHDLFLYKEPSEILQAWKAQGYTHLLFNRFGADFVKAGDSRYTIEDWEKLDNLLSGLSIKSNFGDAYYLYALTP